MNNTARQIARLGAIGLCLLVWTGAGVSAAVAQSILFTKHNLSASGPGPVKATAESRVCIFCHVPHGSRTVAPLWNRHDSTAAYLPYDSPTLKAQVGQPTGSSKLCLSCHDGTIALGDLVNADAPITMAGGDTMPPGDGLIGTDLRDDHPISFDYFESLGFSGGSLLAPSGWDPRVKLDDGDMLQCTTCHDPHDDQWGDFLVMDNQQAMLCIQCHNQPAFNQTPHATSTAQWNGSGDDPWPHTDYPDVQSNACMSCHRSHHAGGQEQLLRNALEEEVCLVCHNGNVATENLEAVFEKPYRHPVEQFSGVHEAGESPLDASGHVECADCHNPHDARAEAAEAPNVMGVMQNVSGVDINGAAVDAVMYEYQVCFKCHGDQAPQPINQIERQIQSFDTTKEFAPSSPSYHPVTAPGLNSDVPSLIAPLSTASMIYCSDCHGNDSATGPAGPHGSSHPFMLVREYRTGDSISESAASYALCYGCHSRSSILNDESFDEHHLHIVDERTSCATCHDGHGIDFGQGNSVNNSHLINFDVSIVDPDPFTGRLEFRSTGPGVGECYLSCHGQNHSPLSY